MIVRRPVGRFLPIAAVVALASALASCAAFDLETAATGPPRADCVDDTPACVERRSAALKEMMGDKKHTWVREPANAHSYAAGVRLFAFKSRKRDLSCDELAHGKREADGAPAALGGPEFGRLDAGAEIARDVACGRGLAGACGRDAPAGVQGQGLIRSG